MKNLINKIYDKLGISSSRTKNISKHVFWSFVYKGGSLTATFLLVPLTISFLDTENYGIWLTLSSFIAWFSFFDIGLGNGLRNRFAEARAKDDSEAARGYISTAYYSIGLISVSFLAISLISNYFLDWTKIFNTSEDLKEPLERLMPIVLGCFSLQLIFKLITSIYTGDQNHSIQGKIGFIISVSSVFLVWLLTHTSESSLLLFGTIFSFLPVVVLFLLNLFAFSTKYKSLKPQRRYFKKEYFADIFGLGFSFFIIQIAVIVMFSTDNFIITQLFSPKEVVPYTIANKYVGIPYMLLIIVLTPYWSSITDAYTRKDYGWIKKSMTNLMRFAVAAIVLIAILTLISPYIYKLWIGDTVQIPMLLTICMAIFFTISICYGPFNFFLNGVGKIKIQMYALGFGALINIPLSIILVKYFNLGVEGVIAASIICVLPNLVLFPIQYYKLVNNKASGIWLK